MDSRIILGAVDELVGNGILLVSEEGLVRYASDRMRLLTQTCGAAYWRRRLRRRRILGCGCGMSKNALTKKNPRRLVFASGLRRGTSIKKFKRGVNDVGQTGGLV